MTTEPPPLGAFTAATGLVMRVVTPSRVEGHLEVTPDLFQPEGLVHGGVWATVVETAGSLGASAAASERGLGVVGVHNSTEFLRPMTSGRAEVLAEPVQQGRTQQLWDVTIRDGAGRLVAIGRLRLQHVERRPPVQATPETSASRHFGWKDVFVAPGDDPRSRQPVFGERATLLDYLASYRQTLELKCAGLDAEALARRSVPPSDLSLLGLVRHLADAEHHWFRNVLAGDASPAPFRTAGDRDAAFGEARGEPEQVEQAWAAWRDEVSFAEAYLEQAEDLGATANLPSGDGDAEPVQVSLREVLVHMIEEYARHCGHADLLRERIDGRVGQ